MYHMAGQYLAMSHGKEYLSASTRCFAYNFKFGFICLHIKNVKQIKSINFESFIHNMVVYKLNVISTVILTK